MTTNATSPFARSLIATLGLWIWVIPSAYFWHLATRHGVVLPYVPTFVWAPAGALWELAPPAYVAVVALSPFAFHRLTTHPRADRRVRRAVWTLAVISLPTALLWGRAIMSVATR